MNFMIDAMFNRDIWSLVGHALIGVLASNTFLIIGLIARHYFGPRGPSDLYFFFAMTLGVIGSGYSLYLTSLALRQVFNLAMRTQERPPVAPYDPLSEKERLEKVLATIEVEIQERLNEPRKP